MTEKAQTLSQKVSARLRAGCLVVIVQESDEQLAITEVKAAADLCQPVMMLSVSGKLTNFSQREPDIVDVMETISKQPTERGTLIVLDALPTFGESGPFVRAIREVGLQQRPDGEEFSRIILIEQPWVKIPQGLTGDSEIISSTLPTVEELRSELDSFLSGVPSLQLAGNGEERYSLSSAVSGTSRHEACRLFARCWVENKKLDAIWLRDQKAKRVTQRLQGALTFENTEGSDVGGLDALKTWLASRKAAFGSSKAREWGLPEPKGLLLLGVPGSGKSLTARCVAREWGLPLLRLDAGRLFGSLVGQSESQTRQAIEAAEACSPCVLWIDEIEKGLSGNSGSLDGGTSSRVFGAILTWLQEKKTPVFVVATANRISSLPPELLRKGRFDEIFYVGLPTVVERKEIIKIHLSRRKRELADEDMQSLAESCDGFSGAEIEQTIIEGLFTAYGEDYRNITKNDVMKAIKTTKPLSVTKKDEILKDLAWATQNTRPASSQYNFKAQTVVSDNPGNPGQVSRPRIM